MRRANDRDQVLAAVVLDAARRALADVLPAGATRVVVPASFRDGNLTVRAGSSVVAAEVRVLSERLKARTTRILKRRGFDVPVTEIRVRFGAPSPRL